MLKRIIFLTTATMTAANKEYINNILPHKKPQIPAAAAAI